AADDGGRPLPGAHAGGRLVGEVHGGQAAQGRHPAEVRQPDIEAATARVAPHVRRTPLNRSADLSKLTGGEVLLKLENLQETGSFKLRGAANAVLAVEERAAAAGDAGPQGLAAVSTGNH